MTSTRIRSQSARGAAGCLAAAMLLSGCGFGGKPAKAAEPSSTSSFAPPAAAPAPEAATGAELAQAPATLTKPRPAAIPAPVPVQRIPAPWNPTIRLTRGARGAAVLALQNRLAELGYDPGRHDARLGLQTRQALWAFQHVNALPALGDVDAATSLALRTPKEPVPFAASAGPSRVEVSIARQVAVVYLNNTVRLITHISSGSGHKWCELDHGTLRCASGNTPRGAFRVHFERRGWRTSYLGKLYQPAYFRGGYALHGSSSVPNYPASHGCVRIPMHVAEYFIDLTEIGMPVIVT